MDSLSPTEMDPRQMVSLALMAQRNLFPRNRVARMGNDALQMWNMFQVPPSPHGRDPVMGTGFSTPPDPVFGSGYYARAARVRRAADRRILRAGD